MAKLEDLNMGEFIGNSNLKDSKETKNNPSG